MLPILLLCIFCSLLSFALGWALAKRCHLPAVLDKLLSPLGLGNDDPVTGEDLLEMVDDADEAEIAEDQKEMISNIVGLDDVAAGDIMTHRTDMDAVEENTSCRDVVVRALETGRSRLPIYRKTTDDILGVLYVKDLLCLAEPGRELDKPVGAFVRPVPFVPESCPARRLLQDFKREHCQLAIVVDEYGGTAGLVTMEDILEEIVGDIQDEYDDEELELRATPDGGLLCDGSTTLEDVFEFFDIPLPEKAEEEEFDTAGGLLTDMAGHIPARGEVVAVEWGGLQFRVAETGDRRIEKVQVSRPAPTEKKE